MGLLNKVPVSPPVFDAVAQSINDTFPVELAAPDKCPRYVGRVIRGVDGHDGDAITTALAEAQRLGFAERDPTGTALAISLITMRPIGSGRVVATAASLRDLARQPIDPEIYAGMAERLVNTCWVWREDGPLMKDWSAKV